MKDIIIRNKSSLSDTMVMMRVAMFMSGGDYTDQQDVAQIEKRKCSDGSLVYIVSDNIITTDWKEAAEGLAKVIESRKKRNLT